MSTKIQFISVTGDTSLAARKAQRKLASSHVTARRHFENRRRDVENFNEKRAQGETSSMTESRISPAISTASPESIEALNNNNATATPSNQAQLTTDPPLTSGSAQGQESIPELETSITPASASNILRPASEGGNLLELPVCFPMLRMVSGRMDPFKPLPGHVTPRMRPHIYYYISVLMPSLHPAYTTNLTRKTFGCNGLFAKADELTVTYTSAFAATSRAVINGDLSLSKLRGLQEEVRPGFHDWVHDWLYFKGRTIKLVNERLQKSAESAGDVLNEPLIHAICNLVLMELFTGNIREAQCHINGVRRIASLWHRRKDQPMSYKVAATIIACIVKVATLTVSTPSTPFYLSFHAPLPFPLPAISHILPSLGDTLISKWPIILSSPLTQQTDLRPIIHDLAQMTRYTEAVFTWEFPYVEDDSYMEYVNWRNLEIEHRVLSIKSGDVVVGVARLACLLYINTVLVRGYPIDSAIIQNVLKAFKEKLEGSLQESRHNEDDHVSPWLGFEDVLLWLAVVGSYCSHAMADREYFADIFRSTAESLCIESVEQARASLTGFLFVERVHGVKLSNLYSS
ncbi:hypothetical protein IQ07DRAFT_680035 [Pyrenochaeta sp. DS3sAY3a]|nr:hypothetical protein IQ07DRAFT_680035 [Pyrenochaeta sp. DS3sAY3a]